MTRSRAFRLFLIPAFISVLIAAYAVFSVRREGLESGTDAPGSSEVSGVRAGSDAWPVFRGDPGLSGLAKGSIAREPILQWRFNTGGPVKSSAVIFDSRVYIASTDGGIYALNITDGGKEWSYDAGAPVEAPPLVADGGVFIGSLRGGFHALDADDGSLLWEHRMEARIVGAANVAEINGRLAVLVGCYDGRLYCFDGETGEVNWVFESGGYVNGAPALIDARHVVFGSCDGLLYVLELETGEVVRQVDTQSYVAGSPAAAGGRVFAGTMGGSVIRFDPDRDELRWSYEGHDAFYSSPAVSEGKVVIGSYDRSVHCLDAVSGELVWRFATQGRVDASPVICGDMVLTGSQDGRIYMISLGDGEQVWSYSVGAAVSSSFAVAEGMLIVGSDDGVVYGFKTFD